MRFWKCVIAFVIGCGSMALSVAGAIDSGEWRENNLRIATLNVHYLVDAETTRINDAELDRLMRWEGRKTSVVTVLRGIDPDIAAFQEMETFAGGHGNPENLQLETMRKEFPTYAFGATGDPRVFPATQPIMYRNERFSPVDEGFFFFSPKPDQLYSDPWFGRYPAFASWLRLHEETTGRHFLIVNVHIDRQRYRNQIRSAQLTAQRITDVRRENDTVVVLGDFNAFRWSRVVRIVRRGLSLTAAPPTGATFHFDRGLHLFPAIDHVLYQSEAAPDVRRTGQTTVSRGLTALSALAGTAVRKRPDGVWPSDHYPVVVDFEY